MPIVGSDDGVRVEYSIPENIKEMITDDFLREFRNQLFRINGCYHLGTFADEGIPLNTSTSGWYAAFGKACLIMGKTDLFDYWNSLEWYDSDIFDGELADMLVDRKLILPDLDEILKEKLGINPEDIVCCSECGGYFTKDMVVEMGKEHEFYDVDYTQYICHHCNDALKGENKNATEYYKSILEELDGYKKNRSVKVER